MKKVIIN